MSLGIASLSHFFILGMSMSTDKKLNDSIETIKGTLFANFYNQYRGISDFIKNLQINQQMKAIILRELDDAYLWTKEAFATLEILPPDEEDEKIVAVIPENIDEAICAN